MCRVSFLTAEHCKRPIAESESFSTSPVSATNRIGRTGEVISPCAAGADEYEGWMQPYLLHISETLAPNSLVHSLRAACLFPCILSFSTHSMRHSTLLAASAVLSPAAGNASRSRDLLAGTRSAPLKSNTREQHEFCSHGRELSSSLLEHLPPTNPMDTPPKQATALPTLPRFDPQRTFQMRKHHGSRRVEQRPSIP